MIKYHAFLRWGLSARGALIVVGDAAARGEREVTLAGSWADARQIGEFAASHLDGLLAASQEPEPGDDVLAAVEAELLAAVNAPIESAAPVVREQRDAAWLRRAWRVVAALARFLDFELSAAAGGG